MKKLSEFNAEVEESVDINLSPLIDMVFLLLIFFMVTAVFVKEVGVEVNKPQSSTSEILEKNNIMLAIDSKGQVFYEDRPVDIPMIKRIVTRELKAQKRPVVLVLDRESQSGDLVKVMDACKLAGAQKISIATEQVK